MTIFELTFNHWPYRSLKIQLRPLNDKTIQVGDYGDGNAGQPCKIWNQVVVHRDSDHVQPFRQPSVGVTLLLILFAELLLLLIIINLSVVVVAVFTDDLPLIFHDKPLSERVVEENLLVLIFNLTIR